MPRVPVLRGIPRIGHLIEMGLWPLDFLTSIQRDHPELVTVSINGGSFTLVTNPTLVEEILVTQQKKFQKDKFLKLYAKPVFGNGLLSSDGDFWLRQRRMAQPAFHRTRIAEYSDAMTRHGSASLATLSAGTWVDIHPVMMRLTLEIVAETLFGEVPSHALQQISTALEQIMHHYAGDSIVQILSQLLNRTLDTAGEVAFQQAVQSFDTVIADIIAARQQDNTPRSDLLSMFLAARDDDGAPMSSEQLRDECKTMFLAGHETTALTMSWTLWLLATHPEIQQRMADEVKTVVGKRIPTLDDIKELPFIEQVIRESMRLYPPAWVIQRESLTDVSLGSTDDPYMIPKEHDVLVSPAAMHRDPRFYPEPDRFLPSRWTPEFIAALPRYAYFPFGGGPRQCIGQQFATMEATLLLAQCMQHGRWQAHPYHRVVAQPSITQRPKYGVKVRFLPHNDVN
ncbi:MAG: cytochrome P450 [Roseiflexaceae bacterium]